MQKIAVKERPIVKNGQKLALGLGDLGYSMVSNTLSSFILFFGNTVMGVPGTLMGLAVAIGTLWDGMTDPIIGYLSDTYSFKYFGRRHGFLLVGIIGITLANIFIWSIPMEMSVVAKFVYFTVLILLLETFNTCFATPNTALSVEISRNYNERTSIQAYRSVFAILGLLLPTLLMGAFQSPTEQYPDGRFNPAAYTNYAFVASSFAILSGIIMFISTYSHVPRLKAYAEKNKDEDQKPQKLKEIVVSFFQIFKKRSFRSIILGYSVAMMAATIIVAFGFNVFTFTFNTTTMQMYLIMAGLFVMTILSQPLWLYMSRKRDKKNAMLLGLFIALIGCFMLFAMFLMRDFFNQLLTKGFYAVIFMMPPLMVAGFGVGVLFSLPLALIGDAIVVENKGADKDKTAFYTGFMTLAYKASRALSQLILGVLLDVIGFKAGSAVQDKGVEASLGWILCIGVTASILGGILIISRYNIKKKDVEAELEK